MTARSSSGNNNNNSVLLLLLAIVVALQLQVCAADNNNLQMVTNDDEDMGGLSVDFYAATCPELDGIVLSAVQEARRNDAQVTAGLLRIFFHDCFPQGCDASLLLDKNQRDSEQKHPANENLQPAALNLVETIRDRVHSRCGPTVSCADILALATARAVREAGGPWIPMELGRSDSRAPAPWAVGALPLPSDQVPQLLRNFTSRGFDGFDLVALSGAHTVGMARCSTFRDRIDKDPKDSFQWGLAGYCNGDGDRKHDLDRTAVDFDNSYFVQLKNGKGVLTSDQALWRDGGTAWLVDVYANKQDDFFSQFVKSMLKLSRLRGPDPGKVRNNCFTPSFNLATTTSAADDHHQDDDDTLLAAAA